MTRTLADATLGAIAALSLVARATVARAEPPPSLDGSHPKITHEAPLRSPVMLGVGVGMVVLGVASAAVGTVLMTTNSEDCPADASPCGDSSGKVAAGVGMVVGGGVATGVGIPLAIIGGKRRPPPEPWETRSALYLGIGRGSLLIAGSF